MRATVSTRTARLAGGLFVVAGFAASALAWPELPATMDVHWNGAGEADGTAPRAVAVLLLPGLAAALLAVFAAIPRIDPLGENVADFRRHYDTFVLLLVAFLIGVHGMVLATNLGLDVPQTPVVLVATGGVLAYVGVLLGHAEPNWFVGIRTPWTLSSERVWNRTHAVASRLFVANGILLAIAAIVGWAFDAPYLAMAAIGVLMVTAGGLIAYSYYCYRSLDAPGDVPT